MRLSINGPTPLLSDRTRTPIVPFGDDAPRADGLVYGAQSPRTTLEACLRLARRDGRSPLRLARDLRGYTQIDHTAAARALRLYRREWRHRKGDGMTVDFCGRDNTCGHPDCPPDGVALVSGRQQCEYTCPACGKTVRTAPPHELTPNEMEKARQIAEEFKNGERR